MTRKQRKRLRKAKPIKKRDLDALAWKLARAISKLPSEPQDHSKKCCAECCQAFCLSDKFCRDCHYVRLNKDACLKEISSIKVCPICERSL